MFAVFHAARSRALELRFVALVLASGCGATPVHEEPAALAREPARESERVPTDRVHDHLADAAHVVWVTEGAVAQSDVRCVEMSAPSAVSTLGGDVGELLLVLGALEEMSGRALPDDAIAAAVDARARTGALSFHTSRASLDALARSLASDPRFADASGALADIEALVRRPPAALEETLLDMLVLPAHVGCAPLRMMLAHPGEYGVRAELVSGVLRAVIRASWARRAPELTVLESDAERTAVVEVQRAGDDARVPAFEPLEGRTLFVVHPGVASLRSARLTRLASGLAGGIERATEGELASRLVALAARHDAASLRHFARELPVYDVRVREGVPVVSGPSPSIGCRDY